VLVLDGDFYEGGERFEAQSWLRLPAGSTLQAKASPEGCKVWVQAVQKRLVARCRAAVGICGFQLQESGVIEPLW